MSYSCSVVVSFCLHILGCLMAACFASFYQDVDVTWGDCRGAILNNGQLLTLSLDNYSGSGFQSKNEFLFGKIESQLKLAAGNSAGTVTTFYMSSQGSNHDEIDFEFLGNETGQPYTLQTNMYTKGQGNREMQFRLWFDPTADFHTYTILWNPQRIIYLVDGIPIRELNNMESKGLSFPNKQAMRLYASLWDAEGWATQGGRVKTNWTEAPFEASYRGFSADASCVWTNGVSSCATSGTAWMTQELDATAQNKMKWVHDNYMIYDYCADKQRFPRELPMECTV